MSRNRTGVNARARILHLYDKKYRHWSEDKVKFLIENYPLKGPSWCAYQLNYKKSIITNKASRLKLSYNFWTKDHIDFIKNHYINNGAIYCSNSLGCSKASVIWKANKLGLYYWNTRYNHCGKIIGKIMFVKFTGKVVGNHEKIWLCQCLYCGNLFETYISKVSSGHTKSCGCLKKYWGQTKCVRRSLDENGNSVSGKINLWRKTILNRDSYECQICCDDFRLTTHHLNSWNWAINERFDINNGITLCLKCHLDFHYQFGRRNNTRQQFIEFFKDNFSP